jgi:hypothetical protein
MFYTCHMRIGASVESLCVRSVFRPIGEIGGGLAIPVTLVGSVALLLVLLRYISINLISSDQYNIKEVSMVKTLTVRTRVFLSSVFESTWAIGVGGVVGHLLA